MDSLRTFGPWLLLIPLAWWFGDSTVSCAPATSTWPLAALAAAALAFATWKDGHRLATLGGLGLLSLLPVLRRMVEGGIPYGHDLTPHAWATFATARGLAAGDLLPRWADVLGVGMPVGQFYPPVTYLMGGWLVVLGLTVPQALGVLSWLSGVVTAAITHWVCRDLGLSRPAAALAAAASILAPYRLLNLNYRFALGELFGLPLVLLLWHLVLVAALDEGRRRPLAIAAVSALLLLTHPLSAVMAAWGLLPSIALLVWHDRDALRGGLAVVGAGVLGIGLAAFHVVPMAAESGAAQVQAVIPGLPRFYSDHGLHLFQAFERTAWKGIQLSNGLTQEGPEMPLNLGLMLLAPLPWMLRAEVRIELRALAIAAIWTWLCALSLPAEITGHVAPLRTLQFPWRFLGPTTVAAAVVAGGWLHKRVHPALAALLVLLWTADGYSGLGAVSWISWDHDATAVHSAGTRPSPTCDGSYGWAATPWEPEPSFLPADDGPLTTDAPWAGWPTGDVPWRTTDLKMPPNDLQANLALVHRAQPEFFTRSTATRFRDPLHEAKSESHRDAGHAVQHGPHKIRTTPVWPWVRLHAPNKSFGLAAHVERPDPGTIRLTMPETLRHGELEVVEQNFPGWEVRLDDGPWAPVVSTRGTLTTPVLPETRVVEFSYTANTLPRRLGMLGTALAVLAFAILWGRTRQSPSRRAP